MWKTQYQEGGLIAVAAVEEVVPASELTAALKQVRELQRLLGKKTMEFEILKEAVEYGQSRKWIAHEPLLPKDERCNRRNDETDAEILSDTGYFPLSSDCTRMNVLRCSSFWFAL